MGRKLVGDSPLSVAIRNAMRALQDIFACVNPGVNPGVNPARRTNVAVND